MSSKSANRARLTEGPVGPTLIKLVVPMIWGVLAVMSQSIVDAYFVGQLGAQELAAIAYILPIAFFVTSMTLGLTVGTSAVLARQIGAEDWTKVRRTVTHVLILGFGLMLSLLFLGVLGIEEILKLQDVPPESWSMIKSYLGIWMWSMFPLVLAMITNGAMRAHGDTLASSSILIMAALANAVLDPILIFGIGDFEGLGFRGAAWASMGANFAAALLALRYLIFRDSLIDWSMPSWSGLKASWAAVLVIGVPSALANMVTPVSRALLNRIITDFGGPAVAGFGVVFQLEMLSLIVPLALSSIIGPFIGQNLGAGRVDRMREAMRLVLVFSFIYGIAVMIFMALGREWIARQFIDDDQTIAVITGYLIGVPWSYGFYAVIMMTGAAFNSMGNPKPNFVLYTVRLLAIYVPAAWIGSHYFGIEGIIAASALSNILTGGMALYWCYAHFPKKA